MSFPLNSPEFAQAWRIVSESLLAAIQNGSLSVSHNDISGVEKNPVTSNPPEPNPVPQTQPIKEIKDIRYASRPIKDGKGGYLFKGLKDEPNPESTFEIIRFTDDTCEFTLYEKMELEGRQCFIDNQQERLPESVGIARGKMDAECKITNVVPGQGVKAGLSVKIISPLTVEFQS